MTLDLLARVVHLVGVVLWVGATVAVALIPAFSADELRQQAAQAARRVNLLVATPAMLMAWIGGLLVLVPGWATLYSKAGWMHGKITIALVATGLTGVLTGRLRRAANGQRPLSPGLLKGLALALLATAVIVLGLVVVRPGGP